MPALVTRDHVLSLEQLLDELCNFGQPKLFRMGGGWYCYVEMSATAVGVDFKVASDLSMPASVEAARQCLDRVHAAVQAVAR